jgi:hypothetical protein
MDTEKPEWFHPGGLAMQFVERNERRMIFASRWSSLKVLVLPEDKELFAVRWNVKHGSNEFVDGTVFFSNELLKMAFGLAPAVVTPCRRAFVERYGADYAVQGRCVKRGPHLNIPGPGTGCSGDPNISILLTPEIQREAALFLGVNV